MNKTLSPISTNIPELFASNLRLICMCLQRWSPMLFEVYGGFSSFERQKVLFDTGVFLQQSNKWLKRKHSFNFNSLLEIWRKIITLRLLPSSPFAGFCNAGGWGMIGKSLSTSSRPSMCSRSSSSLLLSLLLILSIWLRSRTFLLCFRQLCCRYDLHTLFVLLQPGKSHLTTKLGSLWAEAICRSKISDGMASQQIGQEDSISVSIRITL